MAGTMIEQQLELLPSSLARNDDPATSKVAAFPHRGTMKRAILDAFTRQGPMTDDELAAELAEYPSPSVKTARSAMTRCTPPLLEFAGVERLSDRGFPMFVWRRVR